MALNVELVTWTHEYILVCVHVDTDGGQTLMLCFFYPSAMRQGLTEDLELPYWLDWQAGNSPDPLVCLPITEVTETHCQPQHTVLGSWTWVLCLCRKHFLHWVILQTHFYFWGDCWCKTKGQSILVSWSQGKPPGDHIVGSPGLYPGSELPASLSLTIIA